MANHGAGSSRRLNDDQLISVEFRYTDPENSIAGLNLAVPDADAHPTIIGYYDETPVGGRANNPGQPFIRCCHCGLRRHWKGHVIRDDRSETYIIGASKCGRDHYGARYENAETAFKADQQRQRALVRWRSMRGLITAYRAELSQLFESSALANLELKIDELRNASPEGFRKLVRIASTADALVEIMLERDHEAENARQAQYERAIAVYNSLPVDERQFRRREGLKPVEDSEPIIRRSQVRLGHLAGAGSFIDSNDVRKLAVAFRKTLNEADAIEDRGTDTVSTAELSRVLREMTDQPRRLDDAITQATFTEVFFERENLDRIERWSRNEARFSYKRDGLALLVHDTAAGNSRIEPMGVIDLPKFSTLGAAKYLNESFEPIMADDF